MLHNLTRERQAHIYASGLMATIAIGTMGLIAACLTALWLVFQFALLVLTSIVSCCAAIESTFASADPLVKFLLLVTIGLVLYKSARKVWR